MIERRKFAELGGANHGWLKAKHHFSFANYYDPARMNWGALRVWNDDEIAAKSGFPPHPHTDMEIITYVREGAITHKDSMGNEGRTEAGDVQVMSAGSGTHHLDVASFGASLIAEAVLMGDCTLADIGDDLHVGVRVWRKPGVRRDRIVIPYPERAPAHALGVVVLGKREMVLGVEPAMIGPAEAFNGSAFDHPASPIHRGEISPRL